MFIELIPSRIEILSEPGSKVDRTMFSGSEKAPQEEVDCVCKNNNSFHVCTS